MQGIISAIFSGLSDKGAVEGLKIISTAGLIAFCIACGCGYDLNINKNGISCIKHN